jgi:hypothetical protein
LGWAVVPPTRTELSTEREGNLAANECRSLRRSLTPLRQVPRYQPDNLKRACVDLRDQPKEKPVALSRADAGSLDGFSIFRSARKRCGPIFGFGVGLAHTY